MNRFYSVILAIISLSVLLAGTTSCSSSATDRQNTSELSPFEVTVQKTDDGVAMTCTEGCAWETLEWGRTNYAHLQKVNEYGTVSELSESLTNDPDLADFLVTIQKTLKGVRLTCSKGCAWNELLYETPYQAHIQTINEMGLVTDITNE